MASPNDNCPRPSRLLTAEERAELYNGGRGLSHHLVAYWPLGDPAVERCLDGTGVLVDPVGGNHLAASPD